MPEMIFSMSALCAAAAVYENLENVLVSLSADRRSSLTSFTTNGPEVAPGSGLLLTNANQATRTCPPCTGNLILALHALRC